MRPHPSLCLSERILAGELQREPWEVVGRIEPDPDGQPRIVRNHRKFGWERFEQESSR